MDSANTIVNTAAVLGQTARTAQIVSEELHNHLLHEKSAQDAIRSLQCEVKSFGDACDVLQLLLNGIGSKSGLTSDEQFFIKVQQALSEYATTMDDLGQHVRSTRSSGKSLFRPGWRQTKSSIKGEDLIRARQRMDSHLLSVQLMLGILNLRALLQASEGVELSLLMSSIQELHRKKSRLRATSQVNSPYLGQDQKLFAGTAILLAEADRFLVVATATYEDRVSSCATATSPYQQSIASTSILSVPTTAKEPAVARSPSLSTNGVADWQPTDAAGTSGDNSDTVNQWMHGLMSELDKRRRSSLHSNLVPSPLNSTRSYSTVPSDVLSSPSTEERLTSIGTFLTEPSISPLSMPLRGSSRSDRGQTVRSEPAFGDDCDDDDFEIEIDLAKNVIKSGKTAFDEGDYAMARGSLLEGLKLLQELPSHVQTRAYDVLELRYQLAMCALSLENDIAVEKALVELLQQEPSSDAHREKLFHASHILAQLYVRTARLGLARQTCNNALRGRRKLFGKEHQAYYGSLSLMARICQLQNASLHAQGYLDMIPAADRQKHDFSHLRVEIDDGKEVVVVAEADSRLRTPPVLKPSPLVRAQSTTLEASFSSTSVSPAYEDIVSPCSPVPQNKSGEDCSPSVTAYPAPNRPIARTVDQSIIRSEDSIKATPLSSASNTGQVASLPTLAPPPAKSTSYLETRAPTRPTPDNDYLGYCKGAWLLQTGDRKAMKKKKEFDYGRSSNAVYWLTCSDSRCEFATEIELSLIGTWSQIWRTKERMGVICRWAFLAKSHVRQPSKVAAHQTLFKCMFCAFQGLNKPAIQGSDLYLDHIAREHRGTDLSEVVLHQASCIVDRICSDRDEFDINLYPTA